MTVPANVREGVQLRPASTGPVFSVISGRLHIRYSARTRNLAGKSPAALDTARERLDRLLSQSSVYMFRHKLEPGLGYVSSDVLRNLTGFTDATGAGRLLLQTRHLDRILTFTG